MPPEYLKRSEKPTLAYHYTPAKEKGKALPLVFFMGGFRSDMSGTKAQFLENQCQEREQAYIRFDYSGHGESEGTFEDGTIGNWKDDTLAILDHITQTENIKNVLLVGSSMGGWIGLLVFLARPELIHSMIGIAAAPDFTDTLYNNELTEEQRTELQKNGRLEAPNDYSDDPYIFTQALFDEAKNHFLLNRKNIIESPLTLIQGMMDTAVPWETAAKIQNAFSGQTVDIVLIEDGDHRLSRNEDLAILDREIENLCQG